MDCSLASFIEYIYSDIKEDPDPVSPNSPSSSTSPPVTSSNTTAATNIITKSNGNSDDVEVNC